MPERKRACRAFSGARGRIFDERSGCSCLSDDACETRRIDSRASCGSFPGARHILDGDKAVVLVQDYDHAHEAYVDSEPIVDFVGRGVCGL